MSCRRTVELLKLLRLFFAKHGHHCVLRLSSGLHDERYNEKSHASSPRALSDVHYSCQIKAKTAVVKPKYALLPDQTHVIEVMHQLKLLRASVKSIR